MEPVRPVPDYVESAGAAALGARLRRLSAALDADARRVYADFGVAFEQRWLGVLDLLFSHGPLTVGELAASLGISHPSVSQTRDSLAQAGLIAWEVDESDRRRRALRLTAEGASLVGKLQPLWWALDRAAIEIDRDAGNVVDALRTLESAIAGRSLYQRVKDILEAGGKKD